MSGFTLGDLFDVDLLELMLTEGYVRSQQHPTWPQLTILNYSEKATYERVWNPATTQCRGLIYDAQTLKVLARPWPKFWNYGEPDAPEIPMGAAVEVTDKLDGSLGILYPTTDGQWAIATRGSFDSEQARHATEVWQQRYSHYTPPQGVTILVEIVYPGNRIVCDYGKTDDLYLLGAVDIKYGNSYGPWEDEVIGPWPAPRASEMRHITTLGEALSQPPRPGAEGMVLRRWHSEDRVKLKQADYVALHRIITGCTKRRLWEHLAVHDCKLFLAPEYLVKRLFLAPDRIRGILDVGEGWLDAYLESTPEEFRSWVTVKVKEMTTEVARKEMLHRAQLLVLCAHLGVAPPNGVPDRELSKRFTALVQDKCPEDFHMVMGLWRGQEIRSELWRGVRPEHELPYRVMSEDVA
jgi:RNA ligase